MSHPFQTASDVRKEGLLKPEPKKCAHDWQRVGYAFGCVQLECSKCGEQDEKDVS